MKTLLFLLAFLAMTSSPFAKTYTILAEDAAGLWAQPDGTGCANDIVIAAFKAVDAEIFLVVTPYVRAKQLVMQGRAFACFSMALDDELKGKVVFPRTPLYTNTATIFVRKSEAVKYFSMADIPPYSVIGTARGYEYPDEFANMVREGRLIADIAPDETHSLKKLAAGRFDFVIMTLDELKTVDFVLKQAGVVDTVQPAFVVGNMDTFVGFAVGYPETADALEEFDAGMAIIKKNGTMEKILASWKAKI